MVENDMCHICTEIFSDGNPDVHCENCGAHVCSNVCASCKLNNEGSHEWLCVNCQSAVEDQLADSQGDEGMWL